MSNDLKQSCAVTSKPSNDLVDRLRYELHCLSRDQRQWLVVSDAADEIERLRHGLQSIANNPGWTDHHARAAGILSGGTVETKARQCTCGGSSGFADEHAEYCEFRLSEETAAAPEPPGVVYDEAAEISPETWDALAKRKLP